MDFLTGVPPCDGCHRCSCSSPGTGQDLLLIYRGVLVIFRIPSGSFGAGYLILVWSGAPGRRLLACRGAYSPRRGGCVSLRKAKRVKDPTLVVPPEASADGGPTGVSLTVLVESKNQASAASSSSSARLCGADRETFVRSLGRALRSTDAQARLDRSAGDTRRCGAGRETFVRSLGRAPRSTDARARLDRSVGDTRLYGSGRETFVRSLDHALRSTDARARLDRSEASAPTGVTAV